MELNPTTQREADERALFKAHFISEGWGEHSFERYDVYDPDDTRGYKSRHVSDMWDGWQARAALAQSEAPAPLVRVIEGKYGARLEWLSDEAMSVTPAGTLLCAFPLSPVAAPEAPASEQQAAVQIQHDVWGVYHKPTGKWVKDRDGRIELLSKQNAKNICINDEYEARHLRIEIHLAIPAATVDAQADTTTASAKVIEVQPGHAFIAPPGTEVRHVEATTASASGARIDATGAFTFPVDDRAPAQQTERMQPHECQLVQPSREMPKIKTWQERTGNHNIRPGSVKHMIAEIAELRAALARAQTKKD